MKAIVLGPKPQSVFEYIKKLFVESFIEPFTKDKRVRMRWAEKQDFIRQVKTLERSAIKNV